MERHACEIRDVADAVLDPAAALGSVSRPRFGGIALFVGQVRDSNHGRAVVALEYDIFEPLALSVFSRIADATSAAYGGNLALYLGHARGRLGIGGLAMVVAAASPHREEAFGACREVVEAVKHTSPIWKREHYADGSSQWSEGCALCGPEGAPGYTSRSVPPPRPR